MTTIVLQVTHQLKNDELSTEIDFPESFLLCEDTEKVQLIGALIDSFNGMVIPGSDGMDLPSVNEAHRLIVAEAAILFPLCSTITLDISDSQVEVPVTIQHERKIGSMHIHHQIVLIDSIVKVLTAMAVVIVKNNQLRMVVCNQ